MASKKHKNKYFSPPPPTFEDLPPQELQLAGVRAPTSSGLAQPAAVVQVAQDVTPIHGASPMGAPLDPEMRIMTRDATPTAAVVTTAGGGSGSTGGVIIRHSQDALLSVAKLIEKGVQLTDLPPDAFFSLSATPRGDMVAYGPVAKRIICPFCGSEIITALIQKRNTWLKKTIACGLCMGGMCCCVCLPYMLIPDELLLKTTHSCPACARPIAEAQTLTSPSKYYY